MLGFILIVSVITLFLNIFIQKRYNIVVDFALYRPVNNTHKWFERILLILFIGLILIAGLALSYTMEIYVILFGFFMILAGFRALMEYKYEKEEKQYILNLLWAISNCVLLIGSIFFIL